MSTRQAKYTNNNFATLLQKFFFQRLIEQRNSRNNTITAYRDTFKLLLLYLKEMKNLPPDAVVLENLNATTVLGFLKYLEQERHNTIRSRNARLAALRVSIGPVQPMRPGNHIKMWA